MTEPTKPRWTIYILPRGSPAWVKWVVIVGFLAFAFHEPVLGVVLGILFAALIEKGNFNW